MPRDLNTTAPVRPGEELDAARLEQYLRPVLAEFAGPASIEQFPSGHSNLTYLVRIGERELVLRRPPFGSPVKSAHDMGREYRVLSLLNGVYPCAPRPLHYCVDTSVLGAPFYLMERVRGVVLRREFPPGIAVSPEIFRRLSESFIENLARLHGLDLQTTGLGTLGKPQGYVQRQVEGWIKRYENAQTDDLRTMAELSSWLADNRPPESGAALVHNDYKLDNIVLDPDDVTRIVGVLDWEMATVGDPLMDLGSTLSYWVEPDDSPNFRELRFAPTTQPGFLNRRQLAEYYERGSGRTFSAPVFYYAFGLFKLAAILQQIYYRYVKGLTTDHRFARFDAMVRVLARQAAKAVDSDHI